MRKGNPNDVRLSMTFALKLRNGNVAGLSLSTKATFRALAFAFNENLSIQLRFVDCCFLEISI